MLSIFGSIRGPFSMLLHSPKLAERLTKLVTFYRDDSVVVIYGDGGPEPPEHATQAREDETLSEQLARQPAGARANRRTVSSRSRATPRERNRCATFAQAMSSTHTTPAASTRRAGRTDNVISSTMPRT